VRRIEGEERAVRHPEWIVRDEMGKPAGNGTWFWAPHSPLFTLDATHPGAIEWVRRNVSELARKGVGYLKWDFASVLTLPGRRHDPRVANDNAVEGVRRLSAVVREAMGPRGVVMDVSGTDAAGVGLFQLLYTCPDTGNTGMGAGHLAMICETVATHLFKNRRWGLLQPSCMVVGLPGPIEEARIRATIAFLAGGHVDLADNFTNLPEDRWQVLLASLPPHRVTARAVDLFHPVRVSSSDYTALCRGEPAGDAWTDEPQGACIWHSAVDGGWDRWDLVGVFNLTVPPRAIAGAQPPRRFEIPLRHLGLNPRRPVWAHEFWSNQFLGAAPVPRRPAGAYRHPGDGQGLLSDSGPGLLGLSFIAPAVKLLVLRRPRPHPWPVATSFHQSGGLELSDVAWDARRRRLTGILRRPAGQQGVLTVAGVAPDARPLCRVGGSSVRAWRSANAALCVPIATRADATRWSVEV
jgi:hypothetical protein